MDQLEKIKLKAIETGYESLLNEEILALWFNVPIEDIYKGQWLLNLDSEQSQSFFCARAYFNRIFRENKLRITKPSDAFDIIQNDFYPDREILMLITMNGNLEVISKKTLTIGLINKTLIHPREIFYNAFKDNASIIIIAHSHPTENIFPSSLDTEITKKLKESCDMVGLILLDHIIYTKKDFYSFYLQTKVIKENNITTFYQV